MNKGILFIPIYKKDKKPDVLFDEIINQTVISKKYKTISFPLNENWLDIGKIKDYKLALTQSKKNT